MGSRVLVRAVPILGVVAMLWGFEAQAATLTVTSAGDGLSGPGCTLRMAVAAANGGSNACGRGTGNGDVVQLGGPSATTITLTPSLGAIQVTSTMTIQGNYQNSHPDYNTVTISTTGAALLQVPGGRAKDVTLTLKWLRLTGAHGNSASGGCIAINGAAAPNNNAVNLTTVQVDHCSALSGGGIYARGNVTLTSSSLHDNHASFGGAVTIDGNGGGGYELAAKGTTFSNNAADQAGTDGQGGAVLLLGGLDASDPDHANISATSCTFFGNRAPYGAGLYASEAHVQLDATTFDSNAASVDAGGMFVNGGGGVLMTNDTFGKNSAVRNGGGMYLEGAISYWEVSFMTVAQNTAGSNGGGVFSSLSGFPTTAEGDSIFAYNSAPQGPDLWGDFTFWGTGGQDYVTNTSGATPPQSGSWSVIDPQLGNLQSINGLPKVYPLLPASMAIDQANDIGLRYDERGGCRPIGAAPDLGAFEYDPAATYTIVSINSGMALDDPGSSHAAGQQMDQWTVNNGSNQAWSMNFLQRSHVGVLIQLVNKASGLTLGVRGASITAGAAVEQNVWNFSDSQEWTLIPSGTPDYFKLNNLHSGQALDVQGASKTAGALIDQWTQNSGANQKWSASVHVTSQCSSFLQ